MATIQLCPRVSAVPFAWLRIGVGILVLAQAILLSRDFSAFFGSQGVVQWETMASCGQGVLRHLWFEPLQSLGISERPAAAMFWVAHVLAALAMLVGWNTRWATVATWISHWILMEMGEGAVYGAVEFLNIALFYLVCSPAGTALSLDARGSSKTPATVSNGILLRTLQIHMALVYTTSGWFKLSGDQWWTCEAIWRAVLRPDLGTFPCEWLAAVPWFAMILSIGSALLEFVFGVLVWFRPLRIPLAVGIISLHMGIGLSLGLVYFSSVMILLNSVAWFARAEPRPLE